MTARARKLGILGGMGPLASAAMHQRILALTHATRDQQHIETLLHCNTRVPDRTEAILHGGASPLPELLRSIDVMNAWGAEVLFVACLTSHHYLVPLRARARGELLDGIAATAEHCRRQFEHIERVGVLATSGTLRAGLFQERLLDAGIQSVVPGPHDQETLVMPAIYADWGIKAGNLGTRPRQRLLTAIDHLHDAGAQVVILGCTELPMVLTEAPIPLVDPVEILCRLAIDRCLASEAVAV